MNQRLCYAAAIGFVLLGSWLWYSAYYDPNDGWSRVKTMQAEVRTYENKSTRMKISNRELGVLVNETKKNPQRMEEIARNRLLMVKPGEIFIVPAKE
ncbi:septum formation initiator family protein [Candidatus Persebacteraceae bacterium Df01]|jgi:cell division protein FtsB|uniref:Septum formation initiator family protein n=1 Tax=Candidatus Doriopsillibacter californiensis TaxID=2970740 RepID=A0ABT7QP63_9GAMM|nr:septum formation initiator family protein [Candidatus Persebacteraceae bacterium Df01]